MAQRIEIIESSLSIWQIFNSFHQNQNAAFLDSSLKNNQGKYSIIALNPYKSIQYNRGGLWVDDKRINENFFIYLKNFFQNKKLDNKNSNLPITDGAVGFFSYDLSLSELNIKENVDNQFFDLPYALLYFYDNFIIEDHQNNKIYIIANGHLKDSQASINEIKNTINNSTFTEKENIENPIEIKSFFNKENYLDTIDTIQSLINAKTIDVINLAQMLKVNSSKKPYDVFLKLRSINPSTFGAYLNYNNYQIISSSPERFLKLTDNIVETRPIKGTRKRGATPQEDEFLKQDLLSSQKEKSELSLVTNLTKQDLLKVCIEDSLNIEDFALEEYSTVFHLVSTITGKLQKNKNAIDLLQSVFPAPSIAGAPKIKAMELIEKFEPIRRGVYTGSIGYLDFNGNCDFNIAIRTILYQDESYYLGVGGGISFDSEKFAEYEETWQKAKALLESLK